MTNGLAPHVGWLGCPFAGAGGFGQSARRARTQSPASRPTPTPAAKRTLALFLFPLDPHEPPHPSLDPHHPLLTSNRRPTSSLHSPPPLLYHVAVDPIASLLLCSPPPVLFHVTVDPDRT
uniref:Uncharacterized protein n=1 Tax=Triticum urartu TaxID=4572 RepID=A0A8R7UCS4_TRIUA